jgi:hypothetical protein
MAVFEPTPKPNGFAYSIDAEKALSAPIGAVSPLWLAFAGAAGAGLAYWWMTRWMRPVNLEAWLSPAKAARGAAEPVADAVPETAAAFAAAEEALEAYADAAYADLGPATMADTEPVAEPTYVAVFREAADEPGAATEAPAARSPLVVLHEPPSALASETRDEPDTTSETPADEPAETGSGPVRRPGRPRMPKKPG